MALIKCHECGKDVSTEAEACPSCGAKPKAPETPPPPPQPPKKKSRTLLYILGGFFILFIISSIFSPTKEEREATEKAKAEAIEAAKTPEQRAAEAKAKEEREQRAADEKKKKEIENMRFARVRAVTSAIRENARNPKSVEWMSVFSDETGDLICLQFRAQNGFGGMTVSYYAVTPGRVIDGGENPNGYNKVCGGKNLTAANNMKFAAN
jgi:rRNA maturation endonuclease Nob1